MEAQISHPVIIKQECEEYNSNNINSNANSDNKVISNKKKNGKLQSITIINGIIHRNCDNSTKMSAECM